MSSGAGPTYTLTLTQLSADGKKAGPELPTLQRPGISGRELHQLLKAAARLAPQVVYPTAPSIRVEAAAGKFIINLRDGRLQLVSWNAAPAHGANPSVDQIFAIVSGEEAEADPDQAPAGDSIPHAGSQRRGRRVWLGAGLVLAIVALNSFTFWQDRRPPRNFLPEFRLLAPETADRLLAKVAGNYETGGRPGDRRLQIRANGTVQWIKFGAGRTTAELRDLTVQPVATGETEGLLTSRQAIIQIKDPLTVVYFGDTYTRVLN